MPTFLITLEALTTLTLVCLVYLLMSGRLTGPKGDKGDRGDKGHPGDRGEDGKIVITDAPSTNQKHQYAQIYRDGVPYHRALIGSPDYLEAERLSQISESGISVRREGVDAQS